MNTLPPNDWTFYEMLNEIVQKEPATSLDAELMGPSPPLESSRASRSYPTRACMTETLPLAKRDLARPVHGPAQPKLVLLP